VNANDRIRVGVLSDTHGLLRPEARAFLVGCDYIIHGGDIGAPSILEDLSALAPVVAVRGNNDTEPWTQRLRETELVRIGGSFVYVIHDLSTLDARLIPHGVGAVISGHSHRPLINRREGVLYMNPGSCGPRRFKLPISIGELCVGAQISARTVELAAR
jgi:putative phosphoesterase